jgi:hypothetical protein
VTNDLPTLNAVASPTRLGTVEDVNGATVSVALAPGTISGLAFVRGVGYRIGQVGSFVRIPMGYVDLFGVVSQVGVGAVPERLAAEQPFGHRWIRVELIGEGERFGDFSRGVSQLPTVGDEVHLLTQEDLGRVYGQTAAPGRVAIGHLASAEGVPAIVDANVLVTRHSVVVGATGAGKSTAVCSIVRALTDPHRFPSARVVIFDTHGEYFPALRDRASLFRIDGDTTRAEKALAVPYWAMTFDELLPLTFGATDDNARATIMEQIVFLKRASVTRRPRAGITPDRVTVDSPVPFSIHRLWFDLHRLVNATHTVAGNQSDATQAFETDEKGTPVEPGDALKVIPPRYLPQTQAAGAVKIFLSSSTANIRRHVAGLAARLRDPRYDFLFRPGQWTPDLDGIPSEDLDSMLREWVGGMKPVAVLDLSGVPEPVLKDVVGSLIRIIYDALFWARHLSEGARERPLLFVLEEAHKYLTSEGVAVDAVKRVVKEGRKYGIGGMIVSQRPSEIDPTILSQCGTAFAMRLTNRSDRAQVTGTVTETLEGLLGMLPILRTGEVLVLGEAVHLPMRVLIHAPNIDHRPRSADPVVESGLGVPGGWNRSREPENYAEVIEMWRKQDPRPPGGSK